MAIARSGAVPRPAKIPSGKGNIPDLTDSQLLERFVARRDEEAFATLIRRYGRLVRSVARS